MARVVPTLLATAALLLFVVSAWTLFAPPSVVTRSYTHTDMIEDHGWFQTPRFFAAAGTVIGSSATTYYAKDYSVMVEQTSGFVWFADSSNGQLANLCPPCSPTAPKDTYYFVEIIPSDLIHEGYTPVVFVVVTITKPDPLATLRLEAAGIGAAFLGFSVVVSAAGPTWLPWLYKRTQASFPWRFRRDDEPLTVPHLAEDLGQSRDDVERPVQGSGLSAKIFTSKRR